MLFKLLSCKKLVSVFTAHFFIFNSQINSMEQIVKIFSIEKLTHDVRRYRIEKPAGYSFTPGQATELSINQPKWKNEPRPFTFTSLNEWPFIEFTIKSYNDHDGVTNALYSLAAGDELVIRDVWGAINYRGEGYFIAGGAGITPFIAILRQLHSDGNIGRNQLFYSNKTTEDIIQHVELNNILGKQVHYILTKENNPLYAKGHIDEDYLTEQISDFSRPFYICGPDKMVEDLNTILIKLGANPDLVVFER
jgi:ferredoxin-NADP reductase